MPLCKGIAYVGTSHARPCPRNAHRGFPFCWQHGEQARDAVAALEADGSDSPDFMLQHLIYRSRVFEQLILKAAISRRAPRVLRALDGNRPGLSLGHLEPLPLEVLYGIFSRLSIHDLRSFKATNSRGHLMASSDTRYISIVTHAPGLIAALYKTGLQSAFTIGRIYTALTRSICTTCDSFAGYVFLPGLQRCCQRCAMYDVEMQPVEYHTAVNDFQIFRKPAKAIPRMLASKENYEQGLVGLERVLQNTVYLVSKAEARRFGTRDFSVMPAVADRFEYNLAVMPLTVLELNGNSLNDPVDGGFHCLGCARAVCSHRRVRTALNCHGCQTSFPGGIDEPRSRGPHDSVSPWSCKAALDRGKLYSRTEILAHTAVCSNVQDYLADLEIEKGRPPYEKKKKSKRRRYAL